MPLSEEELVNVILETLAEGEGAPSAEELREQLTDDGRLGGDSLLLVEILTALEERLGIEIPEDRATARSLASIRSFARRLRELLAQAEADSA